MKKIILSLLLISSINAFSQEFAFKNFDQYKISAGYESLIYPGLGISTQGFKVQLDVPIYERFGATLAYSKHSPFHEFCDDIPVSTTSQYFVVGLNYTFFEKSRWSFKVLAGLDIERDTYKELNAIPSDIKRTHNERIDSHAGSHSDTETFVEGVAGLEIGYQLRNHFQKQ